MESIITTTKKDIIWNYIAIFFNMGAGILVLPMILHFLTDNEVGLNYIMLTVTSMVTLIDFGFSPQIGRNITYALSGAKEIEKEGLHRVVEASPNFRLLATVIESAKYIYKRMSLFVLFALVIGGTPYIYYVTHGFSDVNNTLAIWAIFCVSSYFNVYFIYYRSLLTGSGKIYESSVSVIISKLAYIVISCILLVFGCGLFSVVVANFVSPLVLFAYSHMKFYTAEMRENLPTDITLEEIKHAIKAIWHNAKKIGINALGTFATLKFGTFIIGFFLPLAVVGSFGLINQVIGALSVFASAMFNSYLPLMSNLQIQHNYTEITRKLSMTMLLYWLVMLLGGIALLYFLPFILKLIGSSVVLPSNTVCVLYLIVMLLEQNHSNFATLIVTANEVPFVKAGLLAGLATAILTFLSLRFTNLGLLGVVLAQGGVQLVYNNWKWPCYVMKSLDVNVPILIKTGVDEWKKIINRYLKH